MQINVLFDPAEMWEYMRNNDVVAIDTRNPSSYAVGHIPHAVNVHDIFTYLSTSSPKGMKELTDKFSRIFGEAGLSGKEHAIVYEQSMDTGLGQSCRGYFLLKMLGYEKASVLHGGYHAWKLAGLPISTDVARPKKANFPIDPDAKRIMVDAQTMLEATKDPNIVKLDVRDVAEWIGASSSPLNVNFCPRKGRIPGARWLEWYRMMKPSPNGPVFKNKDEILAECLTVGISEETPVILYCFKGMRTSNTFIALKEAGIEDVRNYLGSWNEWSRDERLPIEEAILNRLPNRD